MSFGMLGKAKAQKVEKPFEKLSLTQQTTLVHRWLRKHPEVLDAIVQRENERALRG